MITDIIKHLINDHDHPFNTNFFEEELTTVLDGEITSYDLEAIQKIIFGDNVRSWESWEVTAVDFDNREEINRSATQIDATVFVSFTNGGVTEYPVTMVLPHDDFHSMLLYYCY